jgi:hypothetical protein
VWYDDALAAAEGHWSLVGVLRGDWEQAKANAPVLAILDDPHESLVLSLWGAKQVQFKRVLWTHSLAKVSRPEIDSLALREQGATTGVGWTARSFATDVLVRFRDRNRLQSIFGKTPDLYNAGFVLKAHRLTRDLPNVQNRAMLDDLVSLFEWIEAGGKRAAERAEAVFVRTMCLLYLDATVAGSPSAVTAMASRPAVQRAAERALHLNSEGEFHMTMVAVALGLHGFDSVDREHRNTPGTVGGRLVRLGDVQCYRGKQVVVAAEVKARPLAMSDLESSLSEVTQFDGAFLIFSEGIAAGDEDDVADRLSRANDELPCTVILISETTGWVLMEIAMLAPEDAVEFAARVAEVLGEHASGSVYPKMWQQLLDEAAAS